MKTKMMVFGLMVIFAGSVFTSCEKSNHLLQSQECLPLDKKDENVMEAVESRSSDQVYYVAQKYKTAYKHIAQKKGECSWTSYTLAAASVARGNGKKYPSNLDSPKATDYRDKINHVREFSGSDSISSIHQYSLDYDKSKYSINTDIKVYETFDEAVFGILGKRKNGNQKPCIFIAGVGTTPHYIILWDLIWGGTAETSYVNVTDPLDGDKNILSTYEDRKRYRNLKTVLDSKSPKTKKYNFLYFD